MGTLGNFGVDSNVGAWLKSYLTDGPLGALPGGRRAPYFPRLCAVTSLLDPETGTLFDPVVLLDGGSNLKPTPPVKITDVTQVRDFLNKIAPDNEDLWSTAFVKYIQTPDVYAGPGDVVKAHKAGNSGAESKVERFK
jgi:hypothetical protein